MCLSKKISHHYGDTEETQESTNSSTSPIFRTLINVTMPSSISQRPPLTTQGPSSCSPPPSLDPPVPSSFSPPPPRSPSRPPAFSIPPQQLIQSPYNCSSQNNYTDLSLRHPPPWMSSDGLATSYRERATEVFVPEYGAFWEGPNHLYTC